MVSSSSKQCLNTRIRSQIEDMVLSNPFVQMLYNHSILVPMVIDGNELELLKLKQFTVIKESLLLYFPKALFTFKYLRHDTFLIRISLSCMVSITLNFKSNYRFQRPPICPFGIGLIQHSNKCIPIVITPITQKVLPKSFPWYRKMIAKTMPPRFPQAPVTPEMIPFAWG